MNSAAAPVIEYRVWTKCQRMFVWAATDSQDLLDSVVREGYSVLIAMLESKYQEEQAELDGYEQVAHDHELQLALEIAS